MPVHASFPCSPVQAVTARWRQVLAAFAGALALVGCSPPDPTQAGAEAMKRGDYRAAVIHLKGAVDAKPASTEPRLLLADALERVYDLSGLEQQLLKALASGGDENAIVPRLALLALDRNELDRIVREFRGRRLPNPQADSTLRGVVAMALVGLRRADDAAEHIKGVVDTPAVVLARAQLLMAGGKVGEALAELKPHAVAGAPWWVLRAASRIASANGDSGLAAEYMKQASAAAPWHHSVTGEYAEALLTARRPDEAAAVRDALRKVAPKYYWTYYLDALLYTWNGRPEDAHAAALRVLGVAPEHVPATLLAAGAELRKNEVLFAQKRLAALVRKQPASLPALRMLAESHMRLGKTGDAADTVRRGMSLAPNDAQLLGLKADIELALGQGKQAAATLTALTKVRPQDGAALLRLADVTHALGDKAAAFPMLEKAAALAQGDAVVQGRLVSAALRMGNPALARKLADAAVAVQPDEPQAQLALAAAQSAQKDAAGARATTLAVLDKKPDTPGALNALTAMSRTPEQRRELVARYAQALEAKTKDPQIYQDYAALARFESKPPETPLAVLEKGVVAAPGSVPLRATLVEEYLRSGNSEKALTTAQAGAGVANAQAEAVALLAATYERLGKNQLAGDVYRKLATEYPQRADWRMKLAQYETAQRPGEAITILRALIAERPFDVAPHLALASIHAQIKPAEALALARQMSQNDELKDAGMLLEGDLLAKAGRVDDALVQFSKAARAGVVPAALLRSVKVLDAAGRSAAAEQEMADALRRYPADPEVVADAAARAQAAGNPGRAVELLQALAVKAPGNAVLLNDLAWAQIAAGRPEALANARRAAAAMPNNANVMHTLGVALTKAGKRDEAIEALRTASNLAPLAPLPRLHLSENLLAAGNRPAALTALRGINTELLDARDKATATKLKNELTGAS